jgi:hypothetical protein
MVSVDKIYKSVLLILNKEQRGYLTPDQFNKIARQVQLELFEASFFKYNKELVRKRSGVINSDYADLSRLEKEKIDIFAKTGTLTLDTNSNSSLPSDLYRLVNLTVYDTTDQIEEVTKSDWNYIVASKLTAPSSKYPIYYRQGNNIKIFPINNGGHVSIDYVRKPLDPTWAYSISSTANGMYIYEPTATGTGIIPVTGSVDFELHPSQEIDLVINILAYAGVTIKDPSIAQAAIAERSYNETQKQ